MCALQEGPACKIIGIPVSLAASVSGIPLVKVFFSIFSIFKDFISSTAFEIFFFFGAQLGPWISL